MLDRTTDISGDDVASRRFYDEHFDFVWSVVSRYADSQDEANDMLQEAFVKLFAGLSSFRGASSLRTWVFRVAYGSALDRLRRRKRERRWAQVFQRLEEPAPSAVADPLLRTRIAQAVAALSSPLRDVFVMYEIHGRAHEDIASALGIPLGTSKSRLSAAREQLRGVLADVWEERHG
ncbi:MAG: RNA polymerase sigma factor [Gemmatimonadota bacterium]